ncbi:MAG: hypothetical protein KJ065_04615 [Anaerolineae bacterium]|nr:hypothetical protein [Anaerolineae bacterium]
MSSELVFTILPFDPWVTPGNEVRLPIDLDDFARQLQAKWPGSEIKIHRSEEGRIARLYVPTRTQGKWNIAGFEEDYSQLYVSGWPKSTAKEIILWYRHYVPICYRLFLVTPENDHAVELTENITLDDIEEMYPYPVSDE